MVLEASWRSIVARLAVIASLLPAALVAACAERESRPADSPPPVEVVVSPPPAPVAVAPADASTPGSEASDAEATAANDDEEGAQLGTPWPADAGEAFGVGGLGLRGVGEGGGGRGEGIGLGNVGTRGHGGGTGMGQTPGQPAGDAGLAPSPKMREGSTTVSAGLPPEVIRRIVRVNYGRFRVCYEYGLSRNAKLSGTVITHFVIGKTGAVALVSDGGSTLADPSVVLCVIRAFERLTFPPPQRGVVSVVYPITFEPGS